MTLKLYIRGTIFLTALDAVVLTYFYSVNIGEDMVRPYLLLKVILDVLLVLGNWKSVRPDRFEVMMISVLLLHAVAGFFVLPMISNSYVVSRAANDLITPMLFLCKIVVFRNLIRQGALTADALRRLVFSLIILSVVQIVIFFVLGRSSGAYAGITPPVNLPMAFGLAFAQPWMSAVALVVILLSGKRSFLLAALVAVVVRSVANRKSRVPFLIGGFFAVVLLIAAGEAASGLLFGDMSDKIKQSSTIVEIATIIFSDGVGALFDDNVRHELYMATAGRSEEVYAILSVMHWYNFFTGLGVGFTYSYLHWYGWVDGYANSHFSPLALTYKFGFIYAILMYRYTFSGMGRLIASKDRYASMVGIGLLMFFMESLFAFNLFVEIFLPLLVALRQLSDVPAVASDAGRRPDIADDTYRAERPAHS